MPRREARPSGADRTSSSHARDLAGTQPGKREVEPLGFIVAGEARRVLSDAQIEADPARVADGWERRFIADGLRAEEMMKLYEELGYEVVADPIRPEHIGGECDDCRLVIQLQFKMIYTRRRAGVRRPGS